MDIQLYLRRDTGLPNAWVPLIGIRSLSLSTIPRVYSTFGRTCAAHHEKDCLVYTVASGGGGGHIASFCKREGQPGQIFDKLQNNNNYTHTTRLFMLCTFQILFANKNRYLFWSITEIGFFIKSFSFERGIYGIFCVHEFVSNGN